MAVYKVPQDVEADDKLIGPFSFRQFIYLIVVAISGAGAWGLAQIFPALAIIPLPIIIFFAALALPLRKDQPMEAYLSAVVSFYFLKSRKRFWQPDGIDSFVTIIPPKDSERILTKNLSEDEAHQRLQYLSELVDTHGWAIRGAGLTPDTSISTDLYYESQQAPDMMDSNTPAAQALTKQLHDDADHQRQEAIKSMQQAASQTPTQTTNTPVAQAPVATTPASEPVSTLPPINEVRARQDAVLKAKESKKENETLAHIEALTQKVTSNKSTPVNTGTDIQIHKSDKPQSAVPQSTNNAPAPPAPQQPQNTSVSTPNTGTMELTEKQANELSQQTDVSIQTLATEANRLAEKNKVLKNGDEVTISFR